MACGLMFHGIFKIVIRRAFPSFEVGALELLVAADGVPEEFQVAVKRQVFRVNKCLADPLRTANIMRVAYM